MTKVDIDMKVELIHGFSNKTRLEILECIKGQEKTVTQIVAEVKSSQSSISQHLSCLRDCGLIVSRQEGKYVYYSIRNEQIYELLSSFDDVLLAVQNDMKTCENQIN